MKSIKTKVFAIALSGIIAASVIVGGFGIFWSNRAIKRDSAEILDLMTEVQTNGLNTMFSDIERSSIVISHYVSENLSDLSVFQQPEAFSKYIGHLESISSYIANCTLHTISVYVRFAPELTNGVESFLWHKKDGVFIQDVLTQFPVYNSNFDNSWYYRARQKGHGIWTEPYYNEDINEYVISFGIPVYKDGQFIAVVGMDIDFDDIAAIVNSISVYNTGYAFLTDEDFTILYHRRIPAGTRLFDNATNFEKIIFNGFDSEFYEYTKKIGRYMKKQERYRMVYKNLENGMRLVVSVPASEIDRTRTRLIISLVISVLGILFVMSGLSIFVSEKLAKPLKELTQSARHIITGNYDLKFTHVPNDEVGELMDTFSFMAKSLKRQFEYINGLVYLDAMTGAKNKRAFIDERDEIDLKIRKSKENNEKFEFALIVFDVNNLKYMNDNFGHEAGDVLIKSACNLIMQNFIYSSVFRIGGDEFVTVLEGKDYQNRVELFTKLRSDMALSVEAAKGSFEKVSLASGMSVYDAEKDADFQAVFERADEEMYKEKVAMKGSAR